MLCNSKCWLCVKAHPDTGSMNMRLHANDALDIERHWKSGICSGPLGLQDAERSPQPSALDFSFLVLTALALRPPTALARLISVLVEALVARAASRCFATSALRAWAVLRRFCDLGPSMPRSRLFDAVPCRDA